MDDRRPDPALPQTQVPGKIGCARPGKLTVFLGYAPGVGKTYAMLETAWQRKREGLDVVAGHVGSHGLFETDSLLAGLELIPRKEIECQGVKFPELDLDAVLARKPRIAVVDELAHANASGCRHRKRWQDVLELLDAGIDVYTALNVHHLESLNDVVRQITGCRIQETVPDSILDRADEIKLVDLPPDELLQRFKDGKVPGVHLGATDRQNLFRKGNLIALRELALRRTAERVDAQMQSYRQAKGVREVWPAAERILVCIGANPRSVRLIRAAKRMAAGLCAEWLAVHVEAPAKVRPNESDLRQLAEHMQLAESLGAETVTLSGHSACDEILTYARCRNVTKIIIGKPTHPRWKDRLFGSVLDQVVRGSGDIDVYVITGDSDETPPPATPGEPTSWRRREWFGSVFGVSAATVVALLLHPYFGLVDLVMVYLLGVVVIAGRTGKGPSLLATILSVAAFDFLFVPPRFTFTVSDVRHIFTFAVMFIVSHVICRLTLRVREQAEAARLRERRTATLYRLSRELAHHRGLKTLAALALKHIGELFSTQVVILIRNERGDLAPPVTGPPTFVLDSQEMEVARWVFSRGNRAGRGTDTLPDARALYLPLTAASQTMGVIGILPTPCGGFLSHEQIQTLEGFASQTALAIERTLMA
ncbi:MAG: sensor histidine kinase KdpD, partial [Deltaproteobacteria bacterium]|nr:sensor histidine kinase KdpD [Deltaproteobacteria bacterium]